MQFVRTLQVSRRVLVVDDDPSIRVVLSEYLASKNLLADVVSTGEEALEYLEKTEYAVLVADKNLPGMNGIALLKTVKERFSDMEVLIITGYASIESALEAIAEGAFDYIPKPWPSLIYLYEKVRDAMTRHGFDVRLHAVFAYLIRTCQELLTNLEESDQAEGVKKLKEILSQKNLQPEQERILIYGSKILASTVEKLGFQVSTAKDMESALQVASQPDVRVVIVAEDEGRMDVVEIAGNIQNQFPDLGIFVIGRESDLDKIVGAIRGGVSDYMLRPLEGRDLFGPRLKRLVSRQQRIVRYRKVLDSLKAMNIDLQLQG